MSASRPFAAAEEARFAELAFTRTAGAPLILGNQVRLLLDAQENYPAWKAAIESARRSIHVEMYIIHPDAVGRAFAELLVRKAKDGVEVRVLYDWWGSFGPLRWGLWQKLRSAGVEVRACNPPRIQDAFAWFSRDHRKLVTVDGKVAYISGLCIGKVWLGSPDRHVEPWRDTGVELRGPAVASIERAFMESWVHEGGKMSEEAVSHVSRVAPEGPYGVRVIATSPITARLFRLDLLWASIARNRLWLSDAYFAPTDAYMAALVAASRGGVDVRLLVPSASDITLIASFSRTQYRPLLEAGVRVFEWNGPMMHAKTAVVDGRWSRVGSSNLNVASWIGNWELDVCIEDQAFGREMEAVFRRDLQSATEIVLESNRKVQRLESREEAGTPPGTRSGSASRAAAAALHLGTSFGVALTQRSLAAGEARAYGVFGLLALAAAVTVFRWPQVLSYTAALVLGYVGISLLIRSIRLWRARLRGRSERSR